MSLEKKISSLLDDVCSFYVSNTTYTTNDSILANNNNCLDYYYDWTKPYVTYPQTYYYYSYTQTKPQFPPMKIVQDKMNRYIEIKMAIAGFSKDNIKVETENNYLIVSGDISKDEAGNEISEYGDDEIIEIKNNLKVESFKRGFEFPIDTPFDYSNPKVSLIDGILKIRIERKPELIKEKKEIVIE